MKNKQPAMEHTKNREECGEQYRRIHWNNRGKKSIVWRCTPDCMTKKCRAKTVSETLQQDAFLRSIQAQTVMDDAAKAEHKKRIRELQAFIRSQPHGITKFDETLGKHLVEK